MIPRNQAWINGSHLLRWKTRKKDRFGREIKSWHLWDSQVYIWQTVGYMSLMIRWKVQYGLLHNSIFFFNSKNSRLLYFNRNRNNFKNLHFLFTKFAFLFCSFFLHEEMDRMTEVKFFVQSIFTFDKKDIYF